MKNDLTERYIYAVTKRMSRRSGNEVAQELRTLIDDMLAERCADGEPSQSEIKAVLTELGDPNELYESYDDDGKGCLIGSPYYTTYKLVLKIVLASVALGFCVGGIVGLGTSAGVAWSDGIIEWLSTLFLNLASAFGFVTLLFAFFYRKNIDIREAVNLDNLPSVPMAGDRISRTECSFSIVFSILFIAIFVFVPQIFCAIIGEPPEIIPIFDSVVIRGSLYPIILFGAAEIVRDAVKLLEGRYSKKVMVTAIGTNIASAIFAFWWLYSNKIMNPVFVGRVTEIFAGDMGVVQGMFGNLNRFLLGVMLLALVIDTAVTVVKTLRACR